MREYLEVINKKNTPIQQAGIITTLEEGRNFYSTDFRRASNTTFYSFQFQKDADTFRAYLKENDIKFDMATVNDNWVEVFAISNRLVFMLENGLGEEDMKNDI